MTCIIVDDEAMACRSMARLISTRDDLRLAGSFSDARSALEFIASNEVDLIFLDNEMPGMSGMELARRLGDGPMLIFCTAYSQYAAESYEVDAVDYLMKPVGTARFNSAVEKAAERLKTMRQTWEMSTTSDFVCFKCEGKYQRLKIDDILFVDGMKDYVQITTDKGRYITRIQLKNIFSIFPSSSFMRANKSCVVNIDRVESFDANDLTIGGRVVAIGPTYKEDVLKRLLP